MKNPNLLGLASLVLFTTACKSSNVMVFEPQVETPLVAGRTGDYGARAHFVPARSLRVPRSPEARPPNLGLRSEDSEQTVAALGAEVGLGERFEVGVLAGTGIVDSACAGAMGKYQLFGPSRAAARAGDVTAGLSGHVSACQSQNDGHDAGIGGTDGNSWKVKSMSQTYDVGASIGYHALDLVMIYGGLALGTTRAEGVVNQDPGTASSGGEFSAHANGEAQSAALGVNYGGPKFWVNLRAIFVHNNSDFINPDHVTAAVGSGLQF